MQEHGLLGPLFLWRNTLGTYSLLNAAAMGALGAALVIGTFVSIIVLFVKRLRSRRRRADGAEDETPELSLVRHAIAGVLLSAPFTPPWITSGMQVQTVTLAFVAAVPACALLARKRDDEPPERDRIIVAPFAFAAVVLLFVAWLARRLAERGDSGSASEGVSAPTLDAGPLLDAEALAAQGRYGEAIHLLLLRTFEVLARRLGSRLAPGMTAREAVARLALPGPARPALADLVEAAETTTFAGLAASESDYQRCAERFGVLQSALAGARG